MRPPIVGRKKRTGPDHEQRGKGAARFTLRKEATGRLFCVRFAGDQTGRDGDEDE